MNNTCFECKRVFVLGDKIKDIVDTTIEWYGFGDPSRFTVPTPATIRRLHKECFESTISNLKQLKQNSFNDPHLARILRTAEAAELNYRETLELIVKITLQINADLQREIENRELTRLMPHPYFIPKPEILIDPKDLIEYLPPAPITSATDDTRFMMPPDGVTDEEIEIAEKLLAHFKGDTQKLAGFCFCGHSSAAHVQGLDHPNSTRSYGKCSAKSCVCARLRPILTAKLTTLEESTQKPITYEKGRCGFCGKNPCKCKLW